MLDCIYQRQEMGLVQGTPVSEIALLQLVSADGHPSLSRDPPEVSSFWVEVFPSHRRSVLAHWGPFHKVLALLRGPLFVYKKKEKRLRMLENPVPPVPPAPAWVDAGSGSPMSGLTYEQSG